MKWGGVGVAFGSSITSTAKRPTSLKPGRLKFRVFGRWVNMKCKGHNNSTSPGTSLFSSYFIKKSKIFTKIEKSASHFCISRVFNNGETRNMTKIMIGVVFPKDTIKDGISQKIVDSAVFYSIISDVTYYVCN
jgi:hypothetical protein